MLQRIALRSAARLLAAGAAAPAATAAALRHQSNAAAMREATSEKAAAMERVQADAASALASAGGTAPAPETDSVAVDASEKLDLRQVQLSPDTFNSLADVYIGALWTRIERGLREAEGEEFDYEVRPERGAMRVLLPYDGRLVVRKVPERRALVVQSNLFEPWEDRDEIEFRLVGEQEWDDEDGEPLQQFVSEALSKYLKVPVRV